MKIKGSEQVGNMDLNGYAIIIIMLPYFICDYMIIDNWG